mgnify:CR=1 FL=1
MNADSLKLAVKEKYSQIANQSLLNQETSCCGGSTCCGELEINMIGDEYEGVVGHVADADLGLGCGLPTQYAGINAGDSVLDLGSGAGNDCFIARSIVGENGSVTGLDFTEAMIAKAKENNQKLGFSNVFFVQGDIEDMPLSDNSFDVVVSNCVLNLVPDKEKAFAEMWRVMKPGGHFCVSDVVTIGTLPEAVQKDMELYAGCVSGAISHDEYLNMISQTGFKNTSIHKMKRIEVPQHLLNGMDSNDEEKGIFSITVSAYKL